MRGKGWNRMLSAGVFFVLLIGTLGCGDIAMIRTLPEREPETGQSTAMTYRFEDIPLPPGMNLNRKESFIYETRTTRTGLLVYEGKGETGRLTNFFKTQMPNHQWRLVSNFELHNVMLTFIKEGSTTIIYILPVDQEMRRIEIRVGPIEIKILPQS